MGKTYSPTRRWLRAERAREHAEMLAVPMQQIRGAGTIYLDDMWTGLAEPPWDIAIHQDETAGDETVYATGDMRDETDAELRERIKRRLAGTTGFSSSFGRALVPTTTPKPG